VSPLDLVDDRFEKLAEELRASRPVASPPLKARVASLGEPEPTRPRWSLPPGRVAVGLAAAALLASFVAAGITGVGSGSREPTSAGALADRSVTLPTAGETGATPRRAYAPSLSSRDSRAQTTSLSPSAQRLQRYDATLRMRVKNVDALSNAAKRAMSLSRERGGYVASVDYATRAGKRGGATIVLRVPIGNVQAALAELTGLGTILQQRTGILDVTRRADRESRQIAKLERQLAAAAPEDAAAIRLRLKTLRAKHARLLRSAELARITLTLTTPASQAAAAPSRWDRTVDDAGAVLLRELEIVLYALVVAGPLLLLGAAAVAASRAARRRADARLLERA